MTMALRWKATSILTPLSPLLQLPRQPHLWPQYQHQ
jgi:hypothetical protein